MPNTSKFSPDGGLTIYDLKDTNGRNMSEELIRDTVGWTGKNIPYYDLSTLKAINTDGTWNDNVYTYRGVTFTVNTDKSISTQGTSTGAIYFELVKNVSLENILPVSRLTEYTLTGCPSGGDGSTYFVRFLNTTKSDYSFDDFGNSRTKNISSWGSTDNIRFHIGINPNTNVDGQTYYPMIRDTRISNATYEPCHKSVNAEKVSYVDNAILGAHNLLLPYPNSRGTQASVSVQGATIQRNSDDTYTLNGTVTTAGGVNIWETSDISKIGLSKKGTYKISCGDFTVSSGGRVYFVLYDTTNNIRYQTYRAGNETDVPEVLFTLDDSNINSKYDVYIWLQQGVVVNNAIIKPMICLASDTDSSFSSHTLTNRRLTEIISTFGLLLISGDDLNNIKTNGLYFADGGVSNSPDGQQWFGLLVIAKDDYSVRQLVIARNAIYSRSYGGSPAAWSNWTKYTGTELNT